MIKNPIRELSRQAREARPELIADMFPRRYKIPEGYISPDIVAISVEAQRTLLRDKLTNKDDTDLLNQLIWIRIGNGLCETGGQVYVADSDLVDILKQSDPVDDASLNEAVFPYDAFVILFRDKNIVDPDNEDEWLCSLSFYKDPAPEDDKKGSAYLRMGFVMSTGSMYSLSLVYPNTSYKDALSSSYRVDAFSGDADTFDQSNGRSFLNSMYFMVIQLIMVISKDINDVEEAVCIKKIKDKKKRNTDNPLKKLDFYLPHYIGKEIVRRCRPVYQEGIQDGTIRHGITPHWRRNYFRWQPCGKGRQDRKLILVKAHAVGFKADKQ